MTRDKFTYSHADTGSQPSSLNFSANERPDAQNFDWWWYTVIQYINGHADEFDRLDSDNDGKVDSAESADNADTVDGWNKNDIKSWVNANADVPDADYADNADKVDGQDYADIQNWVENNANITNADKVDGWDKEDIKNWVNTYADVPYTNYADNADKIDGKHYHNIINKVDEVGMLNATRAGNVKTNSGTQEISDGWETIVDFSSIKDIEHCRIYLDINGIAKYIFHDGTEFECRFVGDAGESPQEIVLPPARSVSSVEVYHEDSHNERAKWEIKYLDE